MPAIPFDSHFPPDKLLWPSADNQMIQTIRLKVCGTSFQTERTQNICMLSLIPTYKDEPLAHGRCELEARRSVHPERM